MRRLILVCCISGMACMIQACSNGSTADNKDSADSAKAVNKEVKPVPKEASDFAVNAYEGGMMEVEAGKLASEKATNKRVREFGAMMVEDHSKGNEKLKAIASSLNIALPDSLGKDERDEINKLAGKKQKDFDKDYMDMMVSDHQHDITEFRKAADKCPDSTLKDFAGNSLPMLEKHLDSARSITGKK